MNEVKINGVVCQWDGSQGTVLIPSPLWNKIGDDGIECFTKRITDYLYYEGFIDRSIMVWQSNKLLKVSDTQKDK